MDNNLPIDDNQKPVTPVETPPTESPSVIPGTPEETPTEKPAEPTIEIGSLGQPSLSTFQNVNGKSSNKSKKIKSIVSVLGILLIITVLPLTVVLVKQRQDIRKNASVTQPAFNDISITFNNETPPSSGNGGTYSTSFKVTNKVSAQRTVRLEKKSCYCTEGNPVSCQNCPSPQIETITLPPNGSTNITISARQPSGSICGSFQNDLTVLAVN
jgi:hypothetical protein